MGSVQLFVAAVKELERCRARVAAAADCFLKGTIPLDELRLESAAAVAAEKARDEALRRWREPTSQEAARRQVSRLTDQQRARLQRARGYIDEHVMGRPK